jgi:succinate dehydrogenase/fumarate reductase flavoprotein subunit
MTTKFNRRGFIGKGLAAAGAAAVTPILAPKAVAQGVDGVRWAEEADIVVLGSGLAGCVTAIEAHDTDPSAEILLLEKMPEPLAGGNSRVAGQSLFMPTDLEELIVYRRSLDDPNPAPEDVVRVWAEAMVSQEPWIRAKLKEVGTDLVPYSYNRQFTAEFADLEGAKVALGKNYLPVPQASGIWKSFKAQLDRRPVRVSYESPVVDLVQDSDSLEVFGVIAERNGKRIAIKARRAVVMCTGGFENNLDMHRNYAGLTRVYALGTPGNTGDGLKILQKAGADMWHLRNRNITSGLWPSMKFPEYPTAFILQAPQKAGSWIQIAKDNRRFWNESDRSYGATHYRHRVHGSWVDTPLPFVLPVHMIFDETARKAGRLSHGERKSMTWTNIVENYVWSPDNSVEIEKGWIMKANSIEELARTMKRKPEEVVAAVDAYNTACANGSDPEFNRDPATMSPISTPPYYAVDLVPGIICTTGGGKRNAKSQVLDHAGTPIPRLYEAGELGSTFGNLYQNGSFLTECIVFGRIAARNAIAEVPWGKKERRSQAKAS